MWPEVTDDYAWQNCVGVQKGGWGGICGRACTSVELKHSFPLKLRSNEFKQHIHLKQNIGNLRRL